MNNILLLIDLFLSMVETIIARGHENVTSRHRTTLEVTKEKEISLRADCIIGVGADKGLLDLSEEFKRMARNENSVIQAVLSVGDFQEVVVGRGHPDLTFSHKTDMVIRKSDYICPRTLMIRADKSSRELNRNLIRLLKDRNQILTLKLEVLPP